MKTFTLLAAFAALATAQSIDPNSVPLSTRSQWCVSQMSQCPLICTQENNGRSATTSNTCDAKTLSFSCVCISGISPNTSQYSLTIPYFECTEFNNQCVNNCGGSSSCQSACRENHPCGAQSPTRVNSSSSAAAGATASKTSGAASTASTTSYSSFGGAGSSGGQTKTGAGAALTLSFGQTFGLGLVVAGLAAGFGLGL